MTEQEKIRLKNKLLKLGEFRPAPGCHDGCHVMGKDGEIHTTPKALHLAVKKLTEQEG